MTYLFRGRSVHVTRAATPTSIFGAPGVLPRGRHRLPRDQVVASQRARLMAAAASLLGEEGYASTTITEIARRARVSPNRFYEHFRDKEECILAAYDVFVGELIVRITAGISPETDWHEFLVEAVGGYLDALDADCSTARAFLIEMDAVGPAARRRRRDGLAAIAAVLREQHARIRERDPSLGPLPDRVYLAVVSGVRALACDALEAAPAIPLAELRDDVLYWITATIRGAAAAADDLGSEPGQAGRIQGAGVAGLP